MYISIQILNIKLRFFIYKSKILYILLNNSSYSSHYNNRNLGSNTYYRIHTNHHKAYNTCHTCHKVPCTYHKAYSNHHDDEQHDDDDNGHNRVLGSSTYYSIHTNHHKAYNTCHTCHMVPCTYHKAYSNHDDREQHDDGDNDHNR